ncbi:protein of unknown function [Vibrio tapetis subsp. tapetis]|uniref:Uncharacterized protein n=1 Tax=Vibrio tapetis subsp. tapetis TaxID=1671868 RepID=A0A2N8ZLC3_9VIBR|nr:protein of unknown function [Vibrio tapetis subsp. tapetis]
MHKQPQNNNSVIQIQKNNTYALINNVYMHFNQYTDSTESNQLTNHHYYLQST